jgi:peptide/nickel transport system permease protein
VVRAEFLALRQREFVQAAEVLGVSHLRIVYQTLLPNALPPVIVLGSLMVANSILTESALSFLGLGDANWMSWGFLVGSGRSVIRIGWWISVMPGLAIFITVLGLNLLGEGLQSWLNPRLSKRDLP